MIFAPPCVNKVTYVNKRATIYKASLLHHAKDWNLNSLVIFFPFPCTTTYFTIKVWLIAIKCYRTSVLNFSSHLLIRSKCIYKNNAIAKTWFKGVCSLNLEQMFLNNKSMSIICIFVFHIWIWIRLNCNLKFCSLRLIESPI